MRFSCTGKHKFKTKRIAKAAKRHASTKVRVYICTHCKYSHIGGVYVRRRSKPNRR